jgi:hypothetical protein
MHDNHRGDLRQALINTLAKVMMCNNSPDKLQMRMLLKHAAAVFINGNGIMGHDSSIFVMDVCQPASLLTCSKNVGDPHKQGQP